MSIWKYLKESMDLEEKRKHGPEHYRTFNDVVRDYKNRPDSDDIYVHFSESFTDSKKQLINQVGVNVHQDYGNPFGIYAYPIKNISGDYKTSAPWAYILKTKKIPKWEDDIAKMSADEYTRCMDILKKKYFKTDGEAIAYEKDVEKGSKHKSYGGVLWYMIVSMSNDKNINKGVRPNIWQTKVWTNDLGYSGVSDKSGNRIIHASEPHQAVWFSSKGYEVLDVVSNKSKDMYDSLSRAMAHKDMNAIKTAIKLGAEPSRSHLHVALDDKNLKLAKILIDAGAGTQGAMRTAIRSEDFSIIDFLLSQGIKFDENSFNALITNANLGFMKAVIDKYKIIPASDSLDYAIREEKPDMIRATIDAGAKPRKGDLDTLVQYMGNSSELKSLFSQLLDLGAPIGTYTIKSVVDSNRSDIFNMLVDLGLLDNIDEKHGSVLINSALKNNNKEILNLLIDRGSKPNSRSIMFAMDRIINKALSSDKYDTESLKTILDLGVEPSSEDLNEALRIDKDLFKLLLKYGAKPNDKTLGIAVRTKNPELVKLAIASGAKANSYTVSDASMINDKEIMRLVLDAKKKSKEDEE